MSKAFTKDDAHDEPLIVRARAPLPPGVANYVTARGLRLLRAEREALEAERTALVAGRRDDDAWRRRLAAADARLAELAALDEASAGEGRVAFTAPIARAVQGLRVGETAVLEVADGEEELEVTAIDHACDSG